MINQQPNYFQLIYRIIIGLIGLWFLSIIWPFISAVVLQKSASIWIFMGDIVATFLRCIGWRKEPRPAKTRRL